MVMKSREFANYNEIIERELQILKTSHEIGSTESEEPSEPSIFQEELSREALAIKIINTRDEVIDSIQRCDSPEIANTTRGFLDAILKIDTLKPSAADEIHELSQRVDRLEKTLPVSYSLYHPATTSILMFIPSRLNDLASLCSLYQERFSDI